MQVRQSRRQDLIKTFKTLGAGYKGDPKKLVWLMSPNTHADYCLNLLETSSRANVGSPYEFLQSPIAVCPSMPDVSAGQANAVILAHQDYLILRRVAGSSITRYTQQVTGIEYGVAEYQGFARFDFNTSLFGSTNPPVSSLSIHA